MKLSPSRAITGSVIMLLGAGLLLSNLNIYSFGNIWGTWWPLLLIGGGVLMYTNDRGNAWWPGLLIIFGILFQFRNLGLITVNPWQLFWPVLLVILGLSILINRSGTSHKVSKAEREDHTAILAGSDARITSQNFQGSNIVAVMGGVKLDLSKAVIAKEATIEIFSFWGGVEIIVPDNVTIKNKMSVIMAGVENHTRQTTPSGSPVLYLTGDIIMAGVEIKN